VVGYKDKKKLCKVCLIIFVGIVWINIHYIIIREGKQRRGGEEEGRGNMLT
jgi:hypothetical protein